MEPLLHAEPEERGNGNFDMKKISVEEYVIDLFGTSFPEHRAAITRNTDLVVDLDADSMTMVSLIFSINEKFGIGTDQLGDILLNCRTVGDLISATERLQREYA
jgi:acyl carrier protein